jgi:hypothetical protein
VLCAVIRPACSQADVPAILDHLAAAIRSRYLGGYSVSIERRQYAHPHYGEPLGGNMRELSPPRPTFSDPRKVAASHITLARLGDKLRYDLRNPGSERWQWITDGRTVWCYRPDLNVYTVNPADPWPRVLGPDPGLPGIEWKYIAKFLAIDKMAAQTKLISDDLPPTRTCPGPSISLEIQLPDAPYVEGLRILSRTHLPCETSIHRFAKRVRMTPSDIDETITWTFPDEPPAPDYFVFSPSKKAKQVQKFPISN